MRKLQKNIIAILLIAIFSVAAIPQDNEICDCEGYGGTAQISDQLVIRYNEQWRSVCSNHFNEEAGQVACRSMFGPGSTLESMNINSQCVNEAFWLDNVQCSGDEENLLNCNHNGLGVADCQIDQCVSLVCTRTSTDLVTALNENNVLIVSYKDEWRYVCDDHFDQNAADVACRSINGQDYHASSLFMNQVCSGLDEVNFWLDDLACTGSEENLAQCGGYQGFGYHNCGGTECIQIECEQVPQPIPNILIHTENGLLAINHENEVRNICDDSFGEADAIVACTQLYGNPNYYDYSHGHQCDFDNGFWLDQVSCSGIEVALEDCNHNPWGEHDCNVQYECVQLYCVGGGPEQPQITVSPPGTLVHGETGILSIIYQDETRAICDDSFTENGAAVACFELYGDSSVISWTTGLPCDYQDFWLDDVICNGNEEFIRECAHTSWGGHNCSPAYECIQVICGAGGYRIPSEQLEIETQVLVPLAHLRHSPEGILYINYMNENRAICDDQWDELNDQVACRELYGESTVISSRTSQRCTERDFWLDNVDCSGSELFIQDCSSNGFGNHNCNPDTECIQLFCAAGGPGPDQEQLIHSEEGILSILHDAEIRAICDDQWTDLSSQTACNSLYGNPAVASWTSGANCVVEDFWLDNVVCDDVYNTLNMCQHNDWGDHNCGNTECIQLYCVGGGPQVPGASQQLAALEHNSTSGILSIVYQGESRAICDDGFGPAEASTACYELYGDNAVQSVQTGFPCDYQSFWLDDVQCNESNQRIDDCTHLPWGQHNCSPSYECVQLFCAAGGPGSQQIVEDAGERLIISEGGILSIEYQGEVRSVCDDLWNDYSSQTACNQLYGNPSVISWSQGQNCVSTGFWLDNVVCNGVYSTIGECSHNNWGDHNCGSTECIQLVCAAGQPQQPGQSGLHHNQVTGILSITYMGETKAICDDGFNQVEAETACYQLYGDRTVIGISQGFACDYQQFWLDDVSCTDRDQTIEQCSHLPWGQHNCNPNTECVELFCAAGGPRPTQTVQILEYTISHGHTGQFKITYEGHAKEICDDSFDQLSANVLCRQMYGVDSVRFDIGQRCTYQDFWLDDVVCNGSENDILSCQHSPLGQHNCDPERECVNVYCDGVGPQYPGVVLVQSNNGILEMIRNGDRKSICDDVFTERGAEIACQEMFGVNVVSFETGQQCEINDFWLDNVDCSGHESRISDCPHNEYGVHNCGSTECIQIVCAEGYGYQPDESPEPTYLVHNQTSGILSINYRGQTESVCDDYFQQSSAEVACFELYGDRQVIEYTQGHECDYSDFWLDDVQCNGDEETIESCPHLAWGQHNCNWRSECIRLICFAGGPLTQVPPPPPPEVPQAHLEHSSTGILSVIYLGQSKAICDDGWTEADSIVACNELYGAELISWSIAHQCIYDDFWLDNVNCQGTERTLQECSANPWGDHNCNPETECVQVWCAEGPSPSQAWLIHEPSGVLSIVHAGELRAICDDGFNDFSAQTACNELYGTSDVLMYATGVACEHQEFWLDQVTCAQVQEQLQDCPHNQWGDHDCVPQSECVLLRCAGFGPQPEGDGEVHTLIDGDVEVTEGYIVQNDVTGILSYFFNGEFRAICDDSFGMGSARVACMELYADPTVISYAQGLACDYQDFWLDDVQCDGEEEYLADCYHLAYGSHNCNPAYECVELFCAAGGPSARVIQENQLIIPGGGGSPIDETGGLTKINVQGILSYTYQEETRAICDDFFNDMSARVACKELYGPSATVNSWIGGQQCASEGFWLDNVQCNGDETALGDCIHNPYGNHDCNSSECIALFCDGEVAPNTAPLVHGPTGMLNVLYNGEIKSVCDDGFSQIDAETACNELYQNPSVDRFIIGQQCENDDFWIDDVDCTEVGNKLTACSHTAFGVHNCNNQECVFLSCTAQPESSEQLIDPPIVNIFLIHNQETGVLSISRNGDVRAICDDGWNQVNSQVACNQLYGSPEVQSFEHGHQCDYQQFWLDNVACSGNEERIKDCPANEWGDHNCSPATECVQLYCEAGGPHQPSGVVTQNPITGIISVEYNQELRGLCDDGFTSTDAQVICRELYGDSTVIAYYTSQECDYNDFWLDQVNCNGDETRVHSCGHNAYGSHDCNPRRECVRVYCAAGGPNLQQAILLHSQSGLIAVEYENEVRQIADTNFDENAASTACFELYQSRSVMNFITGQACEIETGFWLDNLRCTSAHSTIDSCDHNDYGVIEEGVGSNNCVHLFCEAGGPSVPRGRLVHNQETGMLNIRYLGEVRGICDDRFSQIDAQVACLELYGSDIVLDYQSAQECEETDFWLDDVVCSGSEESLDECPHAAWGVHNCNLATECVKIYCQGGGPQPFDPATVSHSQNGIISITYHGETYSLCDSTFNEQAALTVCFELYGDGNFRSYSQNHRCDYENFWSEEIQCQGHEIGLFECDHIATDLSTCNVENSCVQLFCESGPQQDVVQILQDGEGIILVERNGEIKAVCDDEFSLSSAQVFCNQLFQDPEVISFSQGHPCGVQTDFWLDNVVCNGEEATLQQCPHAAWGHHNCNPAYECVQVFCAAGGVQPPVHVTQSATGILSITYNGVAKAICDDHFNDQSAQIACLEMYGSPDFISYSHGHRCTYEEFWVDDVICTGSETRIADCPHSPWGENNCNAQTECIKLFCVGGGAQPITARAYQDEGTGLLLFDVDGDVRGICDDGFGLDEAQVACRELFGNPTVLDYSQGANCSSLTTFFWLDDVNCRGDENMIGECNHLPLEEHNCNPATECIQLICAAGGYRRPEDEGTISLRQSANGAINLVYGGEERSICQHRFSDFSANVVCNQLYGDPVFTRWSGGHQCDHETFWLNNVDCLGDEQNVMECSHSVLGDVRCNSNECVHVYCRSGGARPGASPLLHSDTGILSIMHEGSVKAICDDQFGDNEARIACSELYSNPEVISLEIGQTCVEQEFWLDNVQCNGGETRMSDCNHQAWGEHNCNWQTECIRLSCAAGGYGSGRQPATLEQNGETGILSITYEGETRGVCDDAFGEVEAGVACFELHGDPTVISYSHGHHCDYDSFWTDDVSCSGGEIKIADCQHTSWGNHNCNYETECVALYCAAGGPQIQVAGTLALSPNNILEITYNGVRKSICDDGFSQVAAEVACYELTGDPTVNSLSTGHQCDTPEFWLDDVSCRGSEEFLYECQHTRWGEHNCSPSSECIELLCGEAQQRVVELIHDGETGILGLLVDDVYGAICDDGFNEVDAQVVCNQLYGDPEVISFRQGLLCLPSHTDFWLDDVSCEGNEDRLMDCHHSPLGSHNCHLERECIELFCSAGGPQPIAHLEQNINGILSIVYNGVSKAVCSHGFDDNSARVACTELFQVPEFISYTIDEQCLYQEAWIDRVICEGEETRIQDCQHSAFGAASCDTSSNCIQLYCEAGGPQPDIIYLIHNQENGIISMEYEGVEKAICDDLFDENSALVACRQLYGRRAAVISFSHGNVCDYDDFWLDNVQCNGDERSIAACSHSPFGEHNCNPLTECIQLFCSDGIQPANEPAALTQNSIGILSMQYNNQNRAVCDDGWDDNSARVACLELFGSDQFISYQTEQPCVYEDFWIDDVQCMGNETSLVDCNHRQLGAHNCDPQYECIRLYCFGGGAQPPAFDVSGVLTHSEAGILSYTYHEQSRAICDDGFNDYSANVACTQLYGSPHVISYSHGHACDYDNFWLDDVICNGNELNLAECPHTAWGVHNCNPETECIQLFCQAGGPRPEGYGEVEGQVEEECPEPDRENCAVLYSECGYQGASISLCGDSIDINGEFQENWTVQSVWVPDSFAVQMCPDEQHNIELNASIPCFSGVHSGQLLDSSQFQLIKKSLDKKSGLKLVQKSKLVKQNSKKHNLHKKALLRKNRR